jgi:hypothetical protein
MWQSLEILKKLAFIAEKIESLRSFYQGDTIARGFSDVGFEEFLLVSELKTVSLLTGQSSVIKSEDLKFFFKIPNFEELVNLLTDRNLYVLGFNRLAASRWSPIIAENDKEIYVEGDSPWSSLVTLLYKSVIR